MHVFRIHIRPQGGTASVKETFEYCLKNNILGVGWQVNSTRSPVSWDAFIKEAKQIHNNVQVLKYIKRWVSRGDLVWTRDHNGTYYLARVKSEWEYWMGPEAINKDIDIANIFRVEHISVSLDDVPGKVVVCFRPARTIQEIKSRAAIEYTKYLWNRVSGTSNYEVDRLVASDIFEFMDDEETEDVIFLYMQSKGWFIVPNSRKKDTMSYEFYAVDPTTGKRAITQVKTGTVQINRDSYAQVRERVILFQSQENYTGRSYEHVICLQRSEILDFMSASFSWLPSALQRKLEVSMSLCKCVVA